MPRVVVCVVGTLVSWYLRPLEGLDCRPILLMSSCAKFVFDRYVHTPPLPFVGFVGLHPMGHFYTAPFSSFFSQDLVFPFPPTKTRNSVAILPASCLSNKAQTCWISYCKRHSVSEVYTTSYYLLGKRLSLTPLTSLL